MEKRRKCSSGLNARMSSFDDRVAAKIQKMDFHFEEAEKTKEEAVAGGSKTEGNKGTSDLSPISIDTEEAKEETQEVGGEEAEGEQEEDEETTNQEFSMAKTLLMSKLFQDYFYLEPIYPITNERVWRRTCLANAYDKDYDIFGSDDDDSEEEESRVPQENINQDGESRDWEKDPRFNELADSLQTFHLEMEQEETS